MNLIKIPLVRSDEEEATLAPPRGWTVFRQHLLDRRLLPTGQKYQVRLVVVQLPPSAT